MNKIEARNKYKKIRKEIKNKEEKSILICKKLLLNKKIKESKIIALYMENEDEVNLFSLRKELLKQNKIICVPKILLNNKMEFEEINLDTKFKKSSFNIYEPIINKVIKEDIDVFIIPGIAFSKNNERIGYGKGYYDKYLENNNSSYLIGVCFKECLIEEDVEFDEHDKKMQEVVFA